MRRSISIPVFIFLAAAFRPAFCARTMPADSITIAIAPEYDQVSSSHRFWFGENYRKLWAMPVNMRVLNLSKEKGGLSVVKLGGGMQTKSLRFQDASGREWVLRTIQKYPERGLPENLRPTIARDILQDQVSTGHPFGALAVPVLADALQLPHAAPEVVYVGDDPALGEYRKDFANAVYLFEERAPGENDDTENTAKVQRKTEKDNDISIDQELVVRARLLDILVGDWDRHEDNWRWLEKKTKDGEIYIPVPRDRDKVFYRTSGVFPWILSHQWLKSNLQPYDVSVRDIGGWNFNARYFDRYFLNASSWQVWEREIEFIRKTITDDLAEKALHQMPPNIYKTSGPELLRLLKGRREHLRDIALEYYEFLAKVVDISLSEKREFVNLEYLENGNVRVLVNNKKKDGSKGRVLYDRLFLAAETREIRLYGLGGEDAYSVEGTGRSAIKVRLIGGTSKDSFRVDSAFSNKRRLFIYDRRDMDNSIKEGLNARLRLSTDTAVNSFDPKNFKYDRIGPMALVNYNIDQGLQLRAGFVVEKQGFRKEPFAVKHEFWGNYSTGRKSFIFSYEGHWRKAVGNNDLSVELNSLGPNNLTNFFGIGNETEFLRHDLGGINFYRNRFDLLTANVRLQRSLGRNLRANLGLGTEFYSSSPGANAGRFFTKYNVLDPGEHIFEDRFYAGVVGGLKYDSRDDASMPSKGIFWNTSFTAKRAVGTEADTYGRVTSDLSIFKNLAGRRLVVANRLGGGTTFGAPRFFQLMQLGGIQSLRGFHSNRFTGQTMAYHNFDLRLKLFDFTSYLFPGSVGMLGFHDIGRVWAKGRSSREWHRGYGGGLYIVPADLILIQGAVGFSKEGSLPYISIGFSF